MLHHGENDNLDVPHASADGGHLIDWSQIGTTGKSWVLIAMLLHQSIGKYRFGQKTQSAMLLFMTGLQRLYANIVAHGYIPFAAITSGEALFKTAEVFVPASPAPASLR